jgi:hypothetical protein
MKVGREKRMKGQPALLRIDAGGICEGTVRRQEVDRCHGMPSSKPAYVIWHQRGITL